MRTNRLVPKITKWVIHRLLGVNYVSQTMGFTELLNGRYQLTTLSHNCLCVCPAERMPVLGKPLSCPRCCCFHQSAPCDSRDCHNSVPVLQDAKQDGVRKKKKRRPTLIKLWLFFSSPCRNERCLNIRGTAADAWRPVILEEVDPGSDAPLASLGVGWFRKARLRHTFREGDTSVPWFEGPVLER